MRLKVLTPANLNAFQRAANGRIMGVKVGATCSQFVSEEWSALSLSRAHVKTFKCGSKFLVFDEPCETFVLQLVVLNYFIQAKFVGHDESLLGVWLLKQMRSLNDSTRFENSQTVLSFGGVSLNEVLGFIFTCVPMRSQVEVFTSNNYFLGKVKILAAFGS